MDAGYEKVSMKKADVLMENTKIIQRNGREKKQEMNHVKQRERKQKRKKIAQRNRERREGEGIYTRKQK